MERLIVVALLLLAGCQKAEISEKSTTDEGFTINANKVAEIATEPPQNESYNAGLIYDPDYGETPEEVQRVLDELQRVENALEESTGDVDVNGYGWVQLQYSATYHITENHLTRNNGLIRYAGHRETWYSIYEPGQTVTAREIPGKHIADDGTIRDEDGYICVASSDLPFYSIVMTSVGPGKVYDCGCSHGTVDIYTDWR